MRCTPARRPRPSRASTPGVACDVRPTSRGPAERTPPGERPTAHEDVDDIIRYTHTSKHGAHRRRRAVAGLGPRSPLPGARSRRARSGRWSAQACGPAWAGDRIEVIENSKRLMAVATRRARTVLGGPRLWFCQVSRGFLYCSEPRRSTILIYCTVVQRGLFPHTVIQAGSQLSRRRIRTPTRREPRRGRG